MKRIKFSIRALLLLAVVVAIGIVVYQRQTKIRNVVLRLESYGGKVQYHPSQLDWLHTRTGHFFATVKTVDLAHSRIRRSELAGIEHLVHLENLYLSRTRIGIEDVAELAKCRKLKRLALWGNHQIGSRSIAELIKLPKLELLDIHDTRVLPVDLGKLGSMPNLQALVFSPEFRSQETDCMNGDTMRQLSSIPHLQPTGDCFLWNLDAEEVRLFCNTDTSRIDDLIFRDCELDDQACRAMNQLTADSLDIQSCDFDDRRLHLIDHTKFNRIDIFNRQDQPQPDITLNGLTRWIPAGIKRVSIFDDYIEFHYTSGFFWKYRLSLPNPRLDETLLKQWIDLGMTEITLGKAEHVADNLQVITQANPPIHLLLHNNLFIWNQIAKMSRLQALTVYGSDSNPIHFAEGMELQSLSLDNFPAPNKTTFSEIAKLNNLKLLLIKNRAPVSLIDVHPLGELKQLEYVRITYPTNEAKAFLDQIGAQNK